MTAVDDSAALAGGLRPATDAPHTAFSTRAVHIALVSAAIFAIWLCAAASWIVNDTVVPWDSKNQFYAFFRFLAATLHAGESPFWNPYHYGGHPSIADPQSLIFAPAFLLWALFDDAPSIRTFDLIVYAHLLIGGLAVGLFGLRQRWPVAACVIAAVVFMLGGVAAGRLQHTGAILSYALFPPAWLLLQVAMARRSILWALAFSAVFASLALGRNQTAILLSVVLAATAVAEIAMAERPLRYFRKRLPVLIVMGVVTICLIAVPFLLTMQFAGLSNRPAVLLDQALKASLHPLHLAQLAVPRIFGTQGNFWGPGSVTLPDIAYTDDSFGYWFIGAVPFVLLLWLGVAGGGALRRGRMLLTVTIALALAYALGRYTPFYSWAFEWLPVVNKFRRPIDASFVALAALAFLTGHLLSDYVQAGLPRGRMIANAAVAAGALVLVGAGVAFSAESGRGTDALMEAAVSLAIVVVIVLALLLARTKRARGAVAISLAFFAAGELLYWNVGFRLYAEAHALYAVLEKPSATDAAMLETLEKLVRDRQVMGERPRVEMIGIGGAWQNLAMVRKLEATNGYNPLRNGLYDRLVSPGEMNWHVNQRRFPQSFDNYQSALGRALGVEFVVIDRPIDKMPHLIRQQNPEAIQAGPKFWIYRFHNAMPRLKFTRHVQIIDSAGAAASSQLLQNLSADRVLLDGNTPPAMRYSGGPAAPGEAVMRAWRTDRVEIDVVSSAGGVLALHDLYYPGWVAEIDGQRAPILRADVLFRAVEVPPGRHHVVFRFAPLAPDNLRKALKRLTQRR